MHPAHRPLVFITCGPSYEPIDRARRMTNFSTGEIGVHLSEAFLESGAEVICFRGEGATWPKPTHVDVTTFSTNDSLADALRSSGRQPDVILHAAALCDFVVAGVEGAAATNKISSREGEVRLILRPATKILPDLRKWFPMAMIVGWKYELDGNREDAIACGNRQLAEAQTDACVVNGAAFGEGFGVLLPDGSLHVLPDKVSLARFLAAAWVPSDRFLPRAG